MRHGTAWKNTPWEDRQVRKREALMAAQVVMDSIERQLKTQPMATVHLYTTNNDERLAKFWIEQQVEKMIALLPWETASRVRVIKRPAKAYQAVTVMEVVS